MTRVQQAAFHIEEELAGKTVLEAACGCAEFSLCAAGLAERVCCIDLDDCRLDPAVAEHPRIFFQRMDAAHMDCPGGSFDTVVLYNALAHLETVLGPVLEECRRVLRPGGSIHVISSFKLDKRVIENRLIPLLESGKIPYKKDSDAVFAYVKI